MSGEIGYLLRDKPIYYPSLLSMKLNKYVKFKLFLLLCNYVALVVKFNNTNNANDNNIKKNHVKLSGNRIMLNKKNHS